jgi:hypothetical protein
MDKKDIYSTFDKPTKRYFEFQNAQFEFHKLFNLENTDERAIAIIGGTFIEMALEHLLKAFFPEDKMMWKSFSNLISL